MNDKFCRICWNTNGWRKPSGTIKDSGNSFAARFGFGLEEWLFNYEWAINGYRYGFLQPIGKYRRTYKGQRFSASLYTKYDRTTLLAAEISNVYVPELEELTDAFDKMAKRGWIDQMREDIKSVNSGQLDDEVEENLCQDSPNWSPAWSINIRFRPCDVTMFDPMRIVREDHKIARNFRYQPYNRDNEFVPLVDDIARMNNLNEQTRSELQRERAAQHATTVDPRHVRLQNRLYSRLRSRFGNDAVRYEQDYVDLKVVIPNEIIFYEIKTDTTAKKCIRNALGQLLEYSSYPAEQRAQKLVVVGDAPATGDDGNYLRYLREQYSLPIYYARFNWEKKDLESET